MSRVQTGEANGRGPGSFVNVFSSSLSDFGIVGCKSIAAVHFSPAFCPIAGLCGGKSGKNWPRWGRFSLSTIPKSDRLLGSILRGRKRITRRFWPRWRARRCVAGHLQGTAMRRDRRLAEHPDSTPIIVQLIHLRPLIEALESLRRGQAWIVFQSVLRGQAIKPADGFGWGLVQGGQMKTSGLGSSITYPACRVQLRKGSHRVSMPVVSQ